MDSRFPDSYIICRPCKTLGTDFISLEKCRLSRHLYVLYSPNYCSGGWQGTKSTIHFPPMSFQHLEIKPRINLNEKETLCCLGYLKSPCNLDTTHFYLLCYFSELDEALKITMQNKIVIIVLGAAQASLA